MAPPKKTKQRVMKAMAAAFGAGCPTATVTPIGLEKMHIKTSKVTYVVMVPNFYATAKAFIADLEAVHRGATVPVPIFWRDPGGETAHVPLLQVEWARQGKSLKRYTLSQIKAMLKLRKHEKHVAGWLSIEPERLSYVELEGNKARFTVLDLGDVTLDMTHIGPEHRSHGYVATRTSVDYRLPSVYREFTGPSTVRTRSWKLRRRKLGYPAPA